MSLLNKFFNNARARTFELRQSADDGTDRILIQKADGTNMAEIHSDGTDTIITPLSGNVNLGGTLDADGNNITGVGSLGAGEIGSGRHYAEAKSGSDPDSRLATAISDASVGHVIYAELGSTYDSNETIPTGMLVTGSTRQNGPDVSATWTLGFDAWLEGMRISGTITASNSRGGVRNCGLSGSTVTVSNDWFSVVGCDRGSVTFENGTGAGIVDSCVQTSVTDNGNNTIGDISS